jgi:hypothetical protein
VQADHHGREEAALSSTPATSQPTPNASEVHLELAMYGMRCQGCATNLRLGLGELDGGMPTGAIGAERSRASSPAGGLPPQ